MNYDDIPEDMDYESALRSDPLFNTVMNGNNDLLAQLIARGANLNIHRYGTNLLDIAVEYNNFPAVVLLVSNHTDVNIRNETDETPLHTAARHNNFPIAKYLLEHGADISATDYNSNTPVHLLGISDRLVSIGNELSQYFNNYLEYEDEDQFDVKLAFDD
jgi:ankyrin repeat protein